MSKEGFWCIAEPSEVMKRYISLKKIPKLTETVDKYSIIYKLLLRDDQLIIVALGTEGLESEEAGGVTSLPLSDFKLAVEEGRPAFYLDYFNAQTKVCALEYMRDIGYTEKLSQSKRFLFKAPLRKLSSEFKKKVLSTGFVTPFEFKAFTADKNLDCLQKVKVHFLRNYVPQQIYTEGCVWCGEDEDIIEKYHCLLFEGKEICSTCCRYEIQEYDHNVKTLAVGQVYKKIFNREIADKEIAKICCRCGKNEGVLERIIPFKTIDNS